MEKEVFFFQWCDTDESKEYGYLILLDAIYSKKINVCTGPVILKNGRIENLHKITCNKCPLFAKFWYHIYLKDIKLKKNKKYIFLFNEWHPAFLNIGFFDWLKKMENIQTVLVIRNMIEDKKNPRVRNIELKRLKETFDLLVTDEKADADLYNLFFLPDCFSRAAVKSAKVKYDLCFTGADKGRAEILVQIADRLNKHGKIAYDFKLVNCKKKFDGIQNVAWQSYADIIQQDMESNCILDILQPGQTSSTLRYQEAVCLGKKLLTNNINIKKEQFYDPKAIQYFSSVDDIDLKFIMEKVNVNYGYNGEFSPIVFIENIKQKLEESKDYD